MNQLKGLVHSIHKHEEATIITADKEKDVKVTKLTENDDIGAYLTTFER